LEEENKSLRNEIKDLRANLRINKEIIEGFFNYNTAKDKSAFYLNKLKEENLKLTTQLENITREKDDLRAKVTIILYS
jgi:hypothetical protein